jgi:two-component system, OmpR family, alkaline phosphatase synthesis response regulator PhoP
VKKILIVDDMPEAIQSLRHALSRPGVTILEATSGRAALEVHRREHVDLIFLDSAMPGLDGEEVARRIRADPTLRDVSIVMLADDARETTRARAIGAGANDFLARPVRLSEIQARLDRLVGVAARKWTKLLAQVQADDGPASFIGRIVNLSTSGLLLETDGDVDLGRDLALTFSVPGSETRVKAAARVVRRLPGQGSAKWGLRFTSLDEAGRRALRNYVDRPTAHS